MARAARDADTESIGFPLWARFTLAMTGALTLVLAIAGYFIYSAAADLTTTVQERTLHQSALLTAENMRYEVESTRLSAERDMLDTIERKIDTMVSTSELKELREDLQARRALRDEGLTKLKPGTVWKPLGTQGVRFRDVPVVKLEIEYEADGKTQRGYDYRREFGEGKSFDLLTPAGAEQAQQGLLGLIVGMILSVILVGAIVSVVVANQVSGPLVHIVQDIHQLSTGDLRHRTRVQGRGEIAVLARAIDRMTHSLADARETEVELSIRQREMTVAGEVREALLPNATPSAPGFDIADLHMGSQELGGDFHDFIQTPDGRVGMLVCDVSGKGLPGALVGATARAYLRAELSRGGDVKESLFSVNRELARDMRRGMYVSVMYALIDPVKHTVQVACAGHKQPLVRFAASDGKVRLVQPEGIALGFDKGPIFERRLEVAEIQIEHGDRLVVFNTGPAVLVNSAGAELGEKQIYAAIQRFGTKPTEEFLERLRSVLTAHAGKTPLARDIAIITAARLK